MHANSYEDLLFIFQSKVCEQHQICRLRYPSCGQRVPCGAATAACEGKFIYT